VIGRDRRDRSL